MEHEAWAKYYKAYYHSVFIYAFSLCGNYYDAEDLTQSAFLKAFLSWENKGSLKCWLSIVLKNEYMNLLRRKQREAKTADLEAKAADGGQDMLERLIKEEETRHIIAAVMKLPPKQKSVLLDSVYFGISDEQLAVMNGTTKENIRQIRLRARKKLAQLLKEGA